MKNKIILLFALLLGALSLSAAPYNADQAGNYRLTADAAGTKPFTYVWKKDGAVISGATKDNIVMMNVQPSNSGNYSCTISNSAGSIVVDLLFTVAAPTPVVVPPSLPAGITPTRI